MQFAASITDLTDPAAATQQVTQHVSTQLAGAPCHLAFLFASAQYQAPWESLLHRLDDALGHPLVLGCTAGGVLGDTQELEAVPAVSLVAAHLPGVDLHPFTVTPQELEGPLETGFWIEKLGVPPGRHPIGILLPEPFTCDVMVLVGALNAAYPRMPLVGGLASGAQQAGGNALFLNDRVVPEGAVGVALTGDIALHTLVAQGCRPIGRPFIITKAEENVIFELAGVPSTEVLRQLFLTLPSEDRSLARRALFLGVVMNEQRDTFRRGDFLIRNLIGLDPESGALAIGDRIHVGQTVQFQVRDAASSREDLHHLLQERVQPLTRRPAGGLLFSCLGRGQDLYGEPHYDTRTIQASLGRIPLGGFFCNGEIGPVGGRNFVHGFTSSLGLFTPEH